MRRLIASRSARIAFATVCLTLIVVEGLLLVRRLGEEPGGRDGAYVAVPDPPASTPGVGSAVVSEVLASGRIEVGHWIRSDRPIRDLTLSTDLPGSTVRPTARHLVVVVGGRVVARRDTVAAGGSMPVELDGSAREVYLSYVLDGVVEGGRSDSGRALAPVTSLGVTWSPHEGPSVVSVRGEGAVLNLACYSDETASTPRPCGSAEDLGWSVELADGQRDDRVMAQLDLGALAPGEEGEQATPGTAPVSQDGSAG